MADDRSNDGPDTGWTVRLNQVERLEREEGDEGEEFFAVEFELSGLGVTGTLSAMVVDPADETTIIAEALDQLRGGLEMFARVVEQRNGTGPIEQKRG